MRTGQRLRDLHQRRAGILLAERRVGPADRDRCHGERDKIPAAVNGSLPAMLPPGQFRFP
jgi:hypothetical protein